MKKEKLRKQILKILYQDNSISEFGNYGGRVFILTNKPNWSKEEMADKIIELLRKDKQ